MVELSSTQQKASLFLLGLLGVSLFHKLGLQPLLMEEPRRAMIALEMILNNNFIVPTQFGELYFKKPPLWNWMIIAAYKLFGSYSEFAIRFFAVVSFLASGSLVYLFSKKWVARSFAILTSLFYLTSVDLYFLFSQLAEIDLFYSFLSLALFFSIFLFSQSEQYGKMFLIAGILTAIGFLTKGFPSIVFAGVTGLAWLGVNRKWKQIFSYKLLFAVASFVLVAGAYFFVYDQYQSAEEFLRVLWSRSSERTLAGDAATFHSAYHFIQFPFELVTRLFPASLLIVFLFSKQVRSKIWNNDFIRFCLIAFVANFAVYWISPGAKHRYIYMLYPLLVIVLSYGFYTSINEHWKKRVIYVFGILSVLLVLAFVVMPFVNELEFIPNLILKCVLMILIGAAILWIYYKNPSWRLLCFFAMLVLARFGYNFTVLEARANDSLSQAHKDMAQTIVEYSKGSPLYLYDWTTNPHSLGFYIESGRNEILQQSSNATPGTFFIVDERMMDGLPFEFEEVFEYYGYQVEFGFFLVKVVR